MNRRRTIPFRTHDHSVLDDGIMNFKSEFKTCNTIANDFNQDEIKNEPMLWQANYNFARENGGKLTNRFLDNLPRFWDTSKLIIDTRVHMLMPGWLPCIGGWHMDDIPRDSSGQPNIRNPEYNSEHIICFLGDDVSPTELLTGDISVDVTRNIKDGKITYGAGVTNLWEHFDNEVTKNLRSDNPTVSVRQAMPGEMIHFGYGDLHRGSASTGSGWRFFIRATRNTKQSHKNEIRRQVQAYIVSESTGW